jgi:hypothetical protein
VQQHLVDVGDGGRMLAGVVRRRHEANSVDSGGRSGDACRAAQLRRYGRLRGRAPWGVRHHDRLLLCAAPARQEAELLHRWLFDTGRSTARLKPLVAPMSLRDLGKLVLATLKRSAESEVYLSGPWLRGTLAGLNPIARVAWLTLLRWPR